MHDLTTYQLRSDLASTRRALDRGAITLGFIGGSITDPRPGWNWPEPLVAWFAARWPGVRISVENAAIGATGSDNGCFRARSSLVERGCDLVFVEYAVNDSAHPVQRRRRSREGLVRQLREDGLRDVVLVHTFMHGMYEDMLAGRRPTSIDEFETIADHYRLNSVWVGLAALREVHAGMMSWETWLPDGLHPQHRGSLCYGQTVAAMLDAALGRQPWSVPGAMPDPLDPGHWQSARVLPWRDIHWTGPWTLRRDPKVPWYGGQVLRTAAPGARIGFAFTGRGCSVCCDFGTLSGEFRWRIDEGAWQETRRDRPGWVGDDGWLNTVHLVDDLDVGRHQVEIETIRGGEGCRGATCSIAAIGVI